ncbi:peroxisomal ATPase PEX6 [Bacillus rossius redtenbacheri]|uniref:peroxisomal ATPase PEX6 n=1 Tax=Bacillus rossius redtenbacheri TaxID=93214 RepID=UPI002FDDCD36
MPLDRLGGEESREAAAMANTPHSLLSVLHFTSQILFPKYPHALFPLLFVLRLHRLKRRAEVVLESVPRELFRALVPGLLQGDEESCVLIGHGLLNKLKVSGEQWLQLTRPPHGVATLVRAVPVAGLPHSVALATEDLCHNVCCRLAVPTAETVLVADSAAFLGQFASKAVLGLIRPTRSLENGLIDSSLELFFKSPRYLCPGDVFSVPVEKYASGYCGVDALHFKVVELDGPNYSEVSAGGDVTVVVGYYVLKGQTAIVQASDQNEFLPARTGVFAPGPSPVSGENYRGSVLPACPPGPDSAQAELASLLRPFLAGGRRGAWRARPVFLVRGARGSGKRTAVRAAARAAGLRVWEADCLELLGGSPGQAEGRLKFVFARARQYAPCIVLLGNIHVLFRDKDGQEDPRVVACFSDELARLCSEDDGSGGRPATKFVSVIATSDVRDDSVPGVPAPVARLFLGAVDLGAPDAATRAAALGWLCRACGAGLGDGLPLGRVAAQCPGFLLADLAALVTRAVRNRALRTDRGDSVVLRSEDFQSALDGMLAAYSDAIGAPRIPAVRWEDIGGASALKEQILQTITAPLRHPGIAASGLKRSGILLFGPPGTGKTLLAKAVATECSLNFLSVKGPELLNMYVGQSEQNVREVFERARTASPCVVFFDELDSLAPNRGRSGDSGGVMDRVVSQLLAEMDGLQRSSHLFVVATTNRPDLIDPALLRPGRFDKLLYVGASEEAATHLSILRAQTRKFALDKDVDLGQVAEMLPRHLTGADIYSVCSNAWLSAVGRRIAASQSGSPDEMSPVVVASLDFAAAARSLVPSVTPEDLAYFQELRRQVASG